MKILLVNKFFFLNGGSEACMFDGARLLKERGHRVAFLSMAHPRNIAGEDPAYFVSHVDFNELRGLRAKARAAARMLYSLEAKALMDEVIRKERPDIAILHNVYHQLSPSILAPLKRHQVPSLMVLHDYKMVCPVYTLFSGGQPCERCSHRRFFSCVSQRCSKGSRASSLMAAAEMTLHHRVFDAYDGVAAFISPSRFLIEKLAQMGFSRPIHHIPNFIDARDLRPQPAAEENAVLYFGRLTPEKGLRTLIEAMDGVPATCHIIGDGPSAGELHRLAAERGLENVAFTGHLAFEQLADRVRRARAVVLPSEWYENSPRSVLEAFALGKPVVGARRGGIPELVEEGVTGWTFEAGNAADLRRALVLALSNADKVEEMGRNARRFAEQRYGPDLYYERLMTLCLQAFGGR